MLSDANHHLKWKHIPTNYSKGQTLHEIEKRAISLGDNNDCNYIDEVLCITSIYVTK